MCKKFFSIGPWLFFKCNIDSLEKRIVVRSLQCSDYNNKLSCFWPPHYIYCINYWLKMVHANSMFSGCWQVFWLIFSECCSDPTVCVSFFAGSISYAFSRLSIFASKELSFTKMILTPTIHLNICISSFFASQKIYTSVLNLFTPRDPFNLQNAVNLVEKHCSTPILKNPTSYQTNKIKLSWKLFE